VRGVRQHLTIMREAAGPDIDILLDLNFNAKTEGYLRILREIADLDLFWVEIDTLDPRRWPISGRRAGFRSRPARR
jgi:galactonate dehydratase